MKAAGKLPSVAELYVGALLYSTADEAKVSLKFVEISDVDDPAGQLVLGSVRALALRGAPPEPLLVKDDLKREGQYSRSVAVWLNRAVTSGGCALAAHHYAAAVVADAFRAAVERFGHSLTSVPDTMSEAEIGELVERTAVAVRGVGARLAELRGDTK